MNTLGQADQDKAAGALLRASESILHVKRALHFGETPEAERFAEEANAYAQAALRQLVAACARLPGVPAPEPTPLHLLSTDASRRLLAGLRQVQEMAEAVDAERGNVLPSHLPLLPGESRGTGWAETLSELALRLKIEVEGPADRRQE